MTDGAIRGPYDIGISADAINAGVDALITSPAVAAEPDPLADLVLRFSKALLAKLKLAQANGRSGWERDDWEADCQQGLLRHIDKGDPRDVAAYCAFMWHHGWITATPPVRGDREAIIRLIEAHVGAWVKESALAFKIIPLAARQDVRDLADALLSLPVQPGAGEREALESCKGEQLKFEEWAARERYDMTEHPLHYLFLDAKTYAARQGWKAALEYARSVLSRQAPHSSRESK